mgnify:CR=1 FL=1
MKTNNKKFASLKSVKIILLTIVMGICFTSCGNQVSVRENEKNVEENVEQNLIHTVFEPQMKGKSQKDILVTKATKKELVSDKTTAKTTKATTKKAVETKKKTTTAATVKTKKATSTTTVTTKSTTKQTTAKKKITTTAKKTTKKATTVKKQTTKKTTTKKATQKVSYGKTMNFQGTWYEGSNTAYGYSGRTLVSSYSVASNYYPQGTILKITGAGLDGTYRVDDKGGMSNNVVDFFYHYGDVPASFRRAGRVNIQVCEIK